MANRANISAIPLYYLFGEAPKDVAHDFLHIEKISERSAPVQGHIRPHRHGDLNHLFIVTRGSGALIGDDKKLDFSGASILFIPSGIVHGFHFSADIDGFVLTVATDHLNLMFHARGELDPLGPDVQIWPMSDRATKHSLKRWLVCLQRELIWEAPAQRHAIEANLLGILTEIHRLRLRCHAAQSGPAGPQKRLVAQFREQIEKRYKTADCLEHYLAVLRVSEAQLRYACEKLGEKPPMQMLLDRRLLEAKRHLLYTNMTINECAAAVGFDDPAYFSRLFSRHTGQSPKAFRLARRSATA